MVTVGKTCPHSPALKAFALQCRKETERQLDTASIELPAQRMNTPKMTVEGLARPVAELRLQEPMLQFLAIGILPGLETARQRDGMFLSRGHLYTKIRRPGSPVKQIGLKDRLLSEGLRRQAKE